MELRGSFEKSIDHDGLSMMSTREKKPWEIAR